MRLLIAKQFIFSIMSREKTKIEKLREIAEEGNGCACYDLGYMYLKGKNTKQDYSEAAKWFSKAADVSRRIDCTFYDSCYQIAQMHQKGQGFKKNDTEAANWFCKCAQYDYGCLESLAGMYSKGIKADADECKFARLYYEEVEKGDVSPVGHVLTKSPWYREYQLAFFIIGGLVSMILLAWYDWVMIVSHGIASIEILAAIFGLFIGFQLSSTSYQLNPNERVSGIPFPLYISVRKSYFIDNWDDNPFVLFPFNAFSLLLNPCYFSLALLAIVFFY